MAVEAQVELAEVVNDVVEHATRRRRQVDFLGERVQRHTGLAEWSASMMRSPRRQVSTLAT